MTYFNALIGAAAAAEADVFINGPDDGRREALEQAESALWWARIAERFGLAGAAEEHPRCVG